MKPIRAVLVLAVLPTLAFAACGESKEDKAMKSVCSARADIGKQVDHLKSLTVSTATVDDVQESLKAIGSDLSKIKDAQADLSDDRRQQVQTANEAFKSQLQSITQSVGKGLTVGNAKAQLTSALQQLASAYKKSFAPVDCS
jgi:hypothetical protein